MPNFMYVVLDGREYKVRVRADTPLVESFHIDDGENQMILLDGTESRDVIGTYYDHTLTVAADPSAPDDYDAFFRGHLRPGRLSHNRHAPTGRLSLPTGPRSPVAVIACAECSPVGGITTGYRSISSYRPPKRTRLINH